ncbi:MAG: hypothetical protein IJI37_03850 [Opitutales bacterium]|nr:hypothetical protein [Opitutales bacterium]
MRLWQCAAIFLAGAPLLSESLRAEQPAPTEKVKIISACRLDGRWIFNIFDGVSGEKISVKQNAKSVRGYKIESFDESAKVAIIETPHGKYAAQMILPKAQDEPPAPRETRAAKLDGVSRAEILERLK